MLNRLNARERRHVARIKEMDCGVCGAAGPSAAHHVVQHYQYLCIPLCYDCHQGSKNGWHGNKDIWRVRKLEPLLVLNETLKAFL